MEGIYNIIGYSMFIQFTFLKDLEFLEVTWFFFLSLYKCMKKDTLQFVCVGVTVIMILNEYTSSW